MKRIVIDVLAPLLLGGAIITSCALEECRPEARRLGGAHDPVGIAQSQATCDRIWGGANPASTIEFDVPDGYGVGTRVFERVSEEWWACYVTLETLRCEREGWCE